MKYDRRIAIPVAVLALFLLFTSGNCSGPQFSLSPSNTLYTTTITTTIPGNTLPSTPTIASPFYCTPAANYNAEAAAVLLVIAAVLWFSTMLDYFINDGKRLWHFAILTPEGQSELVPWNDVDPEERDSETYNGLYFWIITFHGIRKGICLNSHITPKNRLVHMVKNGLSQNMSVSQWRDMVIKDAYDQRGKKTEQDMIDSLRAKGYKIKYVSGGKSGKAAQADEDFE